MTQFNGKTKVTIDSYDTFKNAVNTNGYDIDGEYGNQCWDGADLLWVQLGRTLVTGNGTAIGAWDNNRALNAGSDFDLIYDVNSLQPGDVVFYRPNHVGFFDGYNGNYIRSLGQNQTGLVTGAPFNIVNIAKSSFAGAMRLKKWHQTPPTPQPTPSPEPNGEVVVGATVQPTRAVSYDGVELADFVLGGTYPVIEVVGDRAVLGNGLNTAFHTGDLRIISQSTPAPSGVVIGDYVKTSATNDAQNGLSLNLDIINDGQSLFSSVNSKGFAVLSKDGVVRAAVPVDSLTAV